MENTVTIDTSLGHHVETTGSGMAQSPELREALRDVIGHITEPQPLTPEDQLTAIANLRRELYGVELALLNAKEALESTRQWDEWQGLKEQRKELQKKLDSALDRTMSLWSQPRML